jgi:O-antigen/teichoic acid export membrane protein
MKVRGILKQSAATFFVANIVYGLTFLGNIALIRMLLPEDFGTLAFAASLVGLIEIFTSFVLSTVYIQQRGSVSLVRTVFQVALAVSVLKLVFAMMLFWVSHGRYDTLIWKLFGVIMVSKIFGLFGPLLTAQLEKRGGFLPSTLVTSGATLIAVGAAVAAVAWGAALYGLLLREVLPPVLTFAAMVIFYPEFLPSRLSIVNHRQLRVVATASTRLYLQRGAELAYMRIPLLMIEAFFGPAALGLYAQATNLVTLVNRMTGIFNQQIALVFFTRNRRDVYENRAGFIWLLLINMLLGLPAMALLMLFPRQLTLFLWNENWIGAVDYLKLMAPLTFLLPLFTILKSRLLGFRHNHAITTVYCVGIAFLSGGLWVIRGVSHHAHWVAGLTTASFTLMVAISAYFMWLSAQKCFSS